MIALSCALLSELEFELPPWLGLGSTRPALFDGLEGASNPLGSRAFVGPLLP
jgi:hypothetical protein